MSSLSGLTFPLLMVAMIGLMWWMSRNTRKRQAEEAKAKEEQLASMQPGTWILTRAGFWGRFVEMDGEVMVLESSSGQEQYWDPRAIMQVGNPPFAGTEDADASADEPAIVDEDEHVFGLDTPETDASGADAPETPDADSGTQDQENPKA